MKHALTLLITALLVFAFSGCSGDAKLTNEKAQQAVTRWLNGNGTAVVTSVLEAPQENTAKADVGLSNFVWNSPKNDAVTAYVFGPGGESHVYSGRAEALFAHYNDGRWVLTKIVTPMGSWDNLNIVATGEGRATTARPAATSAKSGEQSVAQGIKGMFGSHDVPFTAIVTADKARFVLPVGRKDKWEWNVKDPATPPGYESPDYDWDVAVKNGQNSYWFGFRHWNRGEPQSGDLAALIAAGQIISQRGTANWQGHEDAGVRVEAAGDNIVISINGKEHVARVFSNRPENVIFRIRQPDKNESKDVTLTYNK